MNTGSLTDRLLKFCLMLVGRFRGGLGHVNVVANVIFAGMSGSAIADAVGIGRVIIGMMSREGRYPVTYAAAITACAAIIGPIIPPSIPMVVYALVADASIGYLFLAGVVPGLMLAVGVHGDQRRDRPPPPVSGRARGAAARHSQGHAGRLPGAAAAGDPALRHLRRRDDAHRGRGGGRRLCAARGGVHLSRHELAPALPRAPVERQVDHVGGHADRRRARVQLRGHRRERAGVRARSS